MGMLVKKCFVTDGDGEDHPVVDYDGCSLDLSLLSQISYDPEVMQAYATSLAFKYADSNQLFFTCQIRMCQKAMGMCKEITPPKCPERKKEYREEINPPSYPEKNTMEDEEPSAEFTEDEPIKPARNKSSPRSKREASTEKWSNKRLSMQKLREMDTPIGLEMDVASPELLILDGEERRQMSQSSRQLISVLLGTDESVEGVCLPTKTLSVLPFGILTMMMATIWMTIACYKALVNREENNFGYMSHFVLEDKKGMELTGGTRGLPPYMP